MRGAFYNRKHHLCKTVCVTAVCTGKVRVALTFGAIIGKLEMPGPVLQECLMNKAGTNKAFEGSVYRCLVGAADADSFCDLPAGERRSGGEQCAQDGDSGFCPAKVCGNEESVNLFDKACLHWFSCAGICG